MQKYQTVISYSNDRGFFGCFTTFIPIILIQTTLRGCRPEELQNFTKGARRPPGTEAFSPKVFLIFP
ncbi:MAG TPA: hypothetical protein DCO75_09490 [Fibrobacteres bacterium]|nr:hypothetical protein [Fibrobacterota bacterium]